MTPLQAELHENHRRFHTRIAERASTVQQPEDRSYSIPNTPYGVPKIPDYTVKVQPNIEPLYWHCMWFADLIAIRNPRPSGPLLIHDIQNAVARHFSVSKLDMISDRRTANVVLPRQVAMYLAKELTARSLPEIGRRFGGRDHTTVLYAVRKIAKRCIADAEFAGKVATLRSELNV